MTIVQYLKRSTVDINQDLILLFEQGQYGKNRAITEKKRGKAVFALGLIQDVHFNFNFLTPLLNLGSIVMHKNINMIFFKLKS